MGATSVIRGKLLELFDGAGRRDKATVIVEARRPPAAPPRSAQAGVRTSPRELLPARAAAARSSRPEAAVPAESMRAVEAALEDLGVIGGARRNERSGSFVVELTRDQLESLSRNPAVQAIRADTLRRKLS
jgi:hypothetical protein